MIDPKKCSPGIFPLVAIADIDIAVSNVVKQQKPTIANACHIPASPTIHGKRINRITPYIFLIMIG